MSREKPGNYEVGYAKPPQHSRFKSGRSGNPRGRPKGSANLITLLDRALAERVVVTENGKRQRITKREVIVKQIVNKAASADPRATKLILDLTLRQDAAHPEAEARAVELLRAEAERAKEAELKAFHKKIQGMKTDDLVKIHEAMRLLDGTDERPPIPMPPGDPEETS